MNASLFFKFTKLKWFFRLFLRESHLNMFARNIIVTFSKSDFFCSLRDSRLPYIEDFNTFYRMSRHIYQKQKPRQSASNCQFPNYCPCRYFYFYFLLPAISPLAHPWEAILIGAIGALLACSGSALLDRLRIDDPVGCIPTHCFAGAWGLLAVALFAEKDIISKSAFSDEYGILKGGPWRFLGIQMLTIVAVAAWTAATTFLELLLVNKIFGLRVSIENELLGADRVEHGILEFEVTLRQNNDAKENDPEQQRSVKINVPDDLPISLGPDDTDKEYNYFWKIARTKTFATKWRRKTETINETGNGSQQDDPSEVE